MTWITHRKPPPHHEYEWAEACVHIRRISDGVERSFKSEEILCEGGECISTFIWEEGNFSCDCNRRMFFNSAAGEPTGESVCGHGAYIVWIVNPATGEVVYDEQPNPQDQGARTEDQGKAQ
jgi:hypothetical protein